MVLAWSLKKIEKSQHALKGTNSKVWETGNKWNESYVGKELKSTCLWSQDTLSKPHPVLIALTIMKPYFNRFALLADNQYSLC